MDTDIDVLLGIAATHGVRVRPEMGAGAVIEELYAALVEPMTLQPTFYTDFPRETSPLTRPHRREDGLVERWDLVVAGMEIGTAYSELTDPLDQRARLTEQSLKAAAGDPEAMEVDEDFLLALETGMPPSGGLGHRGRPTRHAAHQHPDPLGADLPLHPPGARALAPEWAVRPSRPRGRKRSGPHAHPTRSRSESCMELTDASLLVLLGVLALVLFGLLVAECLAPDGQSSPGRSGPARCSCST